MPPRGLRIGIARAVVRASSGSSRESPAHRWLRSFRAAWRRRGAARHEQCRQVGNGQEQPAATSASVSPTSAPTSPPPPRRRSGWEWRRASRARTSAPGMIRESSPPEAAGRGGKVSSGVDHSMNMMLSCPTDSMRSRGTSSTSSFPPASPRRGSNRVTARRTGSRPRDVWRSGSPPQPATGALRRDPPRAELPEIQICGIEEVKLPAGLGPGLEHGGE